MRGNDPAIRLFGQKIALPAGGGSLAADDEKDSPTREVTEATVDDELVGQETTQECNGNPKTPPIDEDSSNSRSSKAENEQSDAANSQEKPLKKPDKILPCPRCNSMDTKFCYYNNYNVSQPRHFCKACQRYWTAGGTMRNVPVGAGRRKNKNPASHYRHITISEALQAARVDLPSRTSHPALNANGRVLSFGLEAPVCDPVVSILNLPDTKRLNRAQNGFHRIKVAENADDHSSLVTGPSSLEGGGLNHHPLEPLVRGINGFAPPITCVSGLPWPYPWNSAVAPPTTFFPPGYPMPFFPPAANWNCGMPGGWNIPMLSPQSSTSSNQKEHCPTPNSSKLGKHSRDKDDSAPKHKNGGVLVPKILRIDDPDEAAKSSIWTTLGIKNVSFSREGFFKAIQPKGDGNNRPAEASYAMRANPAALSRSIGFHESS